MAILHKNRSLWSQFLCEPDAVLCCRMQWACDGYMDAWGHGDAHSRVPGSQTAVLVICMQETGRVEEDRCSAELQRSPLYGWAVWQEDAVPAL